MEYSYQARDNNTGALRTGTIEAANDANAFNSLQQRGLIVIKITPANKVSVLERVKFFDNVSKKEIVIFSRQFETLIDAKVPIIQALQILRAQVISSKLRSVLGEMGQRIENGDSLSSALARYPSVFSSLYVNLVRAGELSGTLSNSLTYLADQVEKDTDLRSKVIGAMAYPLFIIGALFIVGTLMFIYVLPPLISVLTESGVTLPFTTQILIGTTNFFHHFWWVVVLVIVGVIVGYRMYSNTTGGRFVIDAMKIRLPIFGAVFEKMYMARFARNLATLIAGGIPIVRALESVADSVGNTVYRSILLDAAQQVRNGKTIASTLLTHQEFPIIVSQMIQIGETTARLKEILEKLAIFYEKEMDNTIKTLTTLMEPIIMIILGLAVAVMVAGILLPIYNLASAS